MLGNFLACSRRFTLLIAIACGSFLAAQTAISAEPRNSGALPQVPAPKLVPVALDPRDGDRIVLLGDGLFEREQQDGYLETALTASWPEKKLAFRNLGWSGDTPLGEARAGFGSSENTRSWQPPQQRDPDYGFKKLLQQVREAKPTVVFVAYGSAAAYDEPADRERFPNSLKRLAKELAADKVRLVLVTPTPHERLNPAQPDPKPRNERLAAVAEQIRKIAAEQGYPVLDLYTGLSPAPVEPLKEPSQPRPYASPPLTENGMHLGSDGYRRVAWAAREQLALPTGRWNLDVSVAEMKVAGQDGTQCKNITKTEYGVQFDVSDERLPALDAPEASHRVLRVTNLPRGQYALTVDGQRVAMAGADQWATGVGLTKGPEFAQTETLRAAIIEKNRLYFQYFRPQNEAYIFLFRRHERGDHASEIAQWAKLVERQEEEIARLRTPHPHHYELIREKDYPESWVPSAVADTDPEAERRSFTLADGMEINLFASEPMISNPININFDERGRMWVATSTTYPHLEAGMKPNDKIIVLEDVDHDGRADKSTVFADGLLVPHSVIPGDGGAYVTQSTQLLFLKDTNGDGRADARRVLLTGFGNADVHHMIHTLRWGPDGNLYFNQSIYINSTIETPWGIRQLNAAGTWRFRPTSMRLEVFSRGLVNPWGHTFDAWGQSFGTDGAAGGGISYMFPGSAFMSAADVHRIMAPLNPGHTKACGVEVLSGRHLSEEWRDTLMTTNFLANRVVRYRLSDRGSSYASQPLADLMKSSDRSFRPVDVKMGPDGAIYIVDWYSPVIDHGEVDFHHPLRNHEHGRIWRVTQKGRSLVTPPKLTGASTEELLDALKLPEGWSRDQARRLLKERGAEEVMPALRKWLAGLSPSDPNVEHQRLEALWVCQSMGIVSPRELRSVLKSPDGRARAAAVRVLADWQTHIPDAAKLLAAAVADEYPRVRLEAVTASRQAQTLEAANLAMRVLDQPIDDTLDYAAWLAARELKDFWLAELHAGRPVFGGNSQHLAFALNAVGGRDTLAPLVELARGGKLAGAAKISTLETIAKLGGPDDLAVVVDEVVRSADQDTAEADRLLTALERAAGAKKQAPKNGALIVEVLTNGKTKTSTREISARLCGAWKLVAAREALAKMAGDSSRGTPLATAAALGLASLGDAESLGRLAELAGGNGPTPLRMAAVAAWAGTNPQMAASRAVQLLEKLSAEDDPEPVITAFLSRRDGPQALAAALAGKRLPPAVSDAGVRLVNSSGRDLTALREALLAARAEKLVGTQFSPADQKQLLADVATRGDAARGEMIFRRADTSCMKCHAIGGYGGYVGPDLASLGGGAELPHLLQSILEPSAKIKEGFQTVNVSLTDGWIITGVVKQKTNSTVIVRDALDQLHFIPSGDIDELTQSNISLMPTGLANSLSKDELLHLVRFLSVLGREPRYTVSTRPLVRYWQWLEPSPAAELFARSIASGGEQGAGGKSLKWTTRLSTVAGSLPLSELPKLGGDFQGVSIVRFFVELKEAGSVPFRAVGGEGIRLAAPDGLKPLSADYAVSLPAGRQAITLLIDRQQAGNMLEIELTEAKESGPQAVLVQP